MTTLIWNDISNNGVFTLHEVKSKDAVIAKVEYPSASPVGQGGYVEIRSKWVTKERFYKDYETNTITTPKKYGAKVIKSLDDVKDYVQLRWDLLCISAGLQDGI